MRIKLEAKGEQKGIKKADKKYAKILKQKDQALEENKQVLINSAKAMLKAGMNIQQVISITKLSEKEINNL